MVNGTVDWGFFGKHFRQDYLHALQGPEAYGIARSVLLDFATRPGSPGLAAVALVMGFHLVQDRVAHRGLTGIGQHVAYFLLDAPNRPALDADPKSVLGTLAVDGTTMFANEFKERLVARLGEQGAADMLMMMQTAANELTQEQVDVAVDIISDAIKLAIKLSEKPGVIFQGQLQGSFYVDGVEMPRFERPNFRKH
jgi:hypothetical protein